MTPTQAYAALEILVVDGLTIYQLLGRPDRFLLLMETGHLAHEDAWGAIQAWRGLHPLAPFTDQPRPRTTPWPTPPSAN